MFKQKPRCGVKLIYLLLQAPAKYRFDGYFNAHSHITCSIYKMFHINNIKDLSRDMCFSK